MSTNSNSEGKTFLVGAFIGAIATMLIVVSTVPPPWKHTELRAKAVEVGAAEWVVDPKTGKTTFTWKEKP